MALVMVGPINGAESPKQIEATSLRISMYPEPKSQSLLSLEDGNMLLIRHFLLRSLVHQNKIKGTTTFDLGKSLKQNGNNPSIWDCEFLGSAKWSDGKPLSAADIVLTLNKIVFKEIIDPLFLRLAEKKSETIFAEIAGGKKKSTKIRIHFPFGRDFLMHLLSFPIMPSHQLGEDLSFKTAFEYYSIFQKERRKSPIFSGDFVASYEASEQRLQMTANLFAFKRPQFWEIQIFFINDHDLALLQFDAGKTDLVWFRDGSLLGSEIKRLNDEYEDPAKGAELSIQSQGLTHKALLFNLNPGRFPGGNKRYVDPIKRSWFSNPFFRQGVNLAIDKERMVTTLLQGFGSVAGFQLFTDEKSETQAPHSTPSFNITKAILSLNRAKFHFDPESQTLYDFENRQIEFDLICEKESVLSLRICGEVRKNLKRIGITVNITPKKRSEINDQLTKRFDWESLLISESKINTLYELVSLWHSQGAAHTFCPKQSLPFTEWERELDEMLEGVVFTKSPDLMKANQVLSRVVSEHIPFIELTAPFSLRLTRTRVKDWPLPLGFQ